MSNSALLNFYMEDAYSDRGVNIPFFWYKLQD
jgi:hypothetical protein